MPAKSSRHIANPRRAQAFAAALLLTFAVAACTSAAPAGLASTTIHKIVGPSGALLGG